jgi:DNA-binding NarL/FixJ family response regulator
MPPRPDWPRKLLSETSVIIAVAGVPPAQNTIRIVIVDHQYVVREGLKVLLSTHRDLTVVGEAWDSANAAEVVAAVRPDVIIVDIRSSSPSAATAIRLLRRAYAGFRFVVFTNYSDEQHVCDAISAGAHGYVLKNAEPFEIIAAVRAAHAGRRYMASNAYSRLIERVHGSALTPREQQVVELLVRGEKNKAIAGRLGIAEVTVKGHLKNILGKLSASTRTEAVCKAIERGLVRFD